MRDQKLFLANRNYNELKLQIDAKIKSITDFCTSVNEIMPSARNYNEAISGYLADGNTFSFNFHNRKFYVQPEFYVPERMVLLKTYELVLNLDNIPNTKALYINKMDIKIDNFGNVLNPEGNKLDNVSNLGLEYFGSLLDYIYPDQKIA
jgi:hypothetical protein